jgi:uncharacterized protein YbjT (DUF2867 family)
MSTTEARPPVFITGGTGYVGRPLIEGLLAQGHSVHGLVRPQSRGKLPHGAHAILGNALDATTFAHAIPVGATVVHLVGTPHPSPLKARQFRAVDLPSIRATVRAARRAAARHLVYVSVAHPAPIMQAYIDVRCEGEALVGASGIPATILRPWYVLGPGHRWPYVLLPFYAVCRQLPLTREGATRLGLVTHGEMVGALVHAVQTPQQAGVRVVDVPGIRAAAAIASTSHHVPATS